MWVNRSGCAPDATRPRKGRTQSSLGVQDNRIPWRRMQPDESVTLATNSVLVENLGAGPLRGRGLAPQREPSKASGCAAGPIIEAQAGACSELLGGKRWLFWVSSC